MSERDWRYAGLSLLAILLLGSSAGKIEKTEQEEATSMRRKIIAVAVVLLVVPMMLSFYLKHPAQGEPSADVVHNESVASTALVASTTALIPKPFVLPSTLPYGLILPPKQPSAPSATTAPVATLSLWERAKQKIADTLKDD